MLLTIKSGHYHTYVLPDVSLNIVIATPGVDKRPKHHNEYHSRRKTATTKQVFPSSIQQRRGLPCKPHWAPTLDLLEATEFGISD